MRAKRRWEDGMTGLSRERPEPSERRGRRTRGAGARVRNRTHGSNRLQFSRNPAFIAMHHRRSPRRRRGFAQRTDIRPPMKLHLQSGVALQVTGSGPGWIRVNATTYRGSIVLTRDAVQQDAAAGGFDALAAGDLAALRRLDPEVVLIGTGAAQRFPPPSVLRPLVDAQVGFEIMSTPAACRTYNILAGEGRQVVALLLVE